MRGDPTDPSNRLSVARLAGIAAAAVLLRFALSDELYFRLLSIPPHDMSEGLAFFTTAMHSVFLSGDLAWWNPVGVTGYPQYYQAMVGPLAPTWGNAVFIAWAQSIGVLATFGVHLPEYYQYLFVNYVVLAFLAYWAFAYFCAQFLRTWQALAFAMIVFVLSGIGLWESADGGSGATTRMRSKSKCLRAACSWSGTSTTRAGTSRSTAPRSPRPRRSPPESPCRSKRGATSSGRATRLPRGRSIRTRRDCSRSHASCCCFSRHRDAHCGARASPRRIASRNSPSSQ